MENKHNKEPLPARFIIAIGASAGGLEAIHEFFDHMPANTGFTFVVIQHLSPDHKSLLVELVGKHTNMQVLEATHDLELFRDRVYIIPNKKLMTIKGNKLKLADKVKDKLPNTAIDTFLFTLAREKREKAIGIILSGTGTDGTKGAEAIKEGGGMVIVQDPETAKFDGMPKSAITSGNADLILPPAKMPREVTNYVVQIQLPRLQPEGQQGDTLNQLFGLVLKHGGLDFNLYKTPTLLRRIYRRMAAESITTLEDYVEYLQKKPTEIGLLAKDFLIGVTKFFRDWPAFKVLTSEAIGRAIGQKRDGDPFKVWICACSTGEEAYSIAILIDDLLEKTGRKLQVKLFATDVDEGSIDIAGQNRYPLSIAKEVPADLLRKYFFKERDHYSVIARIRKQIVFARHDVIKSPPFIKNDLIVCRNMLIYMNSLLQQKVLATFHYSLNMGGYLFLGPSENANSIKAGVSEISTKWRIYQKKAVINYGVLHTYAAVTAPGRATARTLAPERPGRAIADELSTLLIEEFGAVGLFIDKDFVIKETLGNFRRYLQLPEKKPELNILHMVSSDVSILLGTAIRKAWRTDKTVHLHRVKLVKEQTEWLVRLAVRPPTVGSTHGYTLVMISELTNEELPREGPNLSNQDFDENQQLYVMEIEAELTETKANLQTVMEEMETINEELQSSNEELLSANEELQSSNEELQSLNEELHTLNAEHQAKIRELQELNDDLDNYFRSTDIGQIFVDGNLRIRKFNPAATTLVNLIDSDIGRPINHISSNIQDSTLIECIHSVLADGQVVEREVQLKNGTHILMRIMPYRKKSGIHDGVVISFIDISVITELNSMISGVFDATASAILAFRSATGPGYKTDFRCVAFNKAASALVNQSSDELSSHPSIADFPDLASLATDEVYARVIRDGRPLQSELSIRNKWYQVNMVRMQEGFIVSFNDVTARKVAEQKLRKNYNELIDTREQLRALNRELEAKVMERTHTLAQSEERFNLVAKATNDTIWDWNLVSNTMWRSDNFAAMFGYDLTEASRDISFWFEHIHPDDRQRVEDSVNEAINNYAKQWSQEYRFRKADGTYAIILDRGNILMDEFGTPYRMVGSVIDITRLNETESRLNTTENKFSKVFESNMIGMFFSDTECRITEANQAFLTMLDFSPNDFVPGRIKWNELATDAFRTSCDKAIDSLNKQGIVPPFENEFLKANGDSISVLMGSALLTEGEDKNYVSYIIDISKQKAAEKRRTELQALIEMQKDEFHGIFLNAPAIISIRRGPDLVYEFVNRAFKDFHGQGDYLGKSTAEVYQNGEFEYLTKIALEVFETGKERALSSQHLRHRNPDSGEERDYWFDIVYTPIHHNDHVVGVASFGFDVTDLVKARQATEELLANKDEFMSIASHELKTPITSLKGSLQILSKLKPTDDGSKKIIPFIDRANKQTDKLIALVEELLDVTRIQAGKMLLNYAAFDLHEMLRESVNEVQLQCNTHQINFTCDRAIPAWGDRSRLEQVVHNFLSNAIKYSPDANEVNVTCLLTDRDVRISVQDFGIGIAEDKKKHLFGRFYRVHDTSSYFTGLGLGLYISAEIVRRHGGEVGFESREGEGSTFWFSLPLDDRTKHIK
ncbi:chemotaxis protein CheB [Parapedobacter sp. GCM10030251]|uniref:chemotaxis protein CheB n=1 Tax=Parapedobacter sp. GCM10030251 TaxID=3273419 RepID=UPI00361CDB6E